MSDPSIHIKAADLEWLAGNLEHRKHPGFTTGQSKDFVLFDRARDGLVPFNAALRLPDENIVEYYTPKRGNRMFGVDLTTEQEVELWMAVYWTIRSDPFRDRITKWLGSQHMEPPPHPSYRRNRRR